MKAYVVIILLLSLLLLLISMIRSVRFHGMILLYRICSLNGYMARNSPYPINYPHGRDDIIPIELRIRFNRIALERMQAGDNSRRRKEMTTLIRELLSFCRENVPVDVRRTVPSFDIITEKESILQAIRERRPFVIKNGQWATQPTLDDLIRKYGDTRVLFDTDSETFTGFFREIRDHKAYLSNSTSFMTKHPEILKQDDIDRIHRLSGMEFTISQMFIGMIRGNGTMIHSAFSHNFFLQVRGRKKWTFWHPDNLCLLYPFFHKYGIYMASYAAIRDYDLDKERLREKWPLIQYAPRYETVLQEGDVLFNPGPWWHAIHNLDDETIGIATRWTFPQELLPSPLTLQYGQLTNPRLQSIAQKIYANTGSFNFDIDENCKKIIDQDSLALIEIYNHDFFEELGQKDTPSLWHPSD